MMYLMFMSILLNFLFMASNHPLSMGLILLAQTLSISLICGLMFPSFWFSYILVLIFLGGMLILFIYIASLAANEKLESSSKMLMWSLILTFSFMTLLVYTNKTLSLKSTSLMFKEPYMWVYNYPMLPMATMLILYLFILLVAVVKIVKWWGGSIRPLS